MNIAIDVREATEQFRNAMREAQYTPPDDLAPDGKLRRFSQSGKPKDDAAYCVLYGDGIPAGCFGDWRTGYSQKWCMEIARELTDEEKAEQRRRQEAARQQREADRVARYAEAAKRAAAIWAASKPGPHGYLDRKGIEAHGTAVYKGALVVPVRDSTGALTSLQFIAADGEKRFLTGGKKEGCYFRIGGKPADTLCIAEGFATGASIHQATGHPVAVAFDAGNLEPVALALRQKLPAGVRLIICGDDDRDTEIRTGRNTGRIKAQAAARAVRGFLALPSFAEVAA